MAVRIFDGYSYRDATDEEIAEFERAAKEAEEERKKQPLSPDDVVAILLGEDAT